MVSAPAGGRFDVSEARSRVIRWQCEQWIGPTMWPQLLPPAREQASIGSGSMVKRPNPVVARA